VASSTAPPSVENMTYFQIFIFLVMLILMLCTTGINYIVKYTVIENSHLTILLFLVFFN